MTMKTWLEEYYPKDAMSQATDDDAALEHSQRKWTGLLEINRKKHDVYPKIVGGSRHITDGKDPDVLIIGWDACSLCLLYIDQGCDECPLLGVRDGFTCTDATNDEKESPYDAFFSKDDARPMLEIIKLAIRENKS